MHTIGIVICPNLKGSSEGNLCCITNDLIRNMEGFSIKLCMSKRHEACSVYKQSLQNMLEHGEYSAHCE